MADPSQTQVHDSQKLVLNESNDQVDLEDGELSDEENDDTQHSSVTADDDTPSTSSKSLELKPNYVSLMPITSPMTHKLSDLTAGPSASVSSGDTFSFSTRQTASESDVSNEKSLGKKRKSSGSSDDNEQGKSEKATAVTGKDEDSSESSSSSEEDKSERKRKKKEEKRRKKEKKREKRKREKQKEREERKKRRKHHHDDYQYDRPPPPNMYNAPYDGFYESGYNDNRGHYYNASPVPGPYDSPPLDESSDDEFYEALYNMVESEPMDPNVSVAERENFLKKSQKKIPGLTAARLQKIMKKRRWKDQSFQQQQQHQPKWRGPPRRVGEESKQKCKFYAEGKCQKGDKCQYSHNFIPAKKMEACKFFLQGYCAKGDMCIYLHSEVPCKYYHTGQKCFNAEKCKFSHDPLTDSTRPLLEKAILLEETGTFKPEKPSLLGSPPKDTFANKFEPQSFTAPPPVSEPVVVEEKVEQNFNQGIPSIFDLQLQPSADLQEKLDAGLYDEITAPLSDGEDEEGFGSPTTTRPQSFYSDTLPSVMVSKSAGQAYQPPENMEKPRRNRWGPDLPTTRSQDMVNDVMISEPIKKTPLLPLPSPPQPFSQPPHSIQSNNPPTSDVVNTQTAQQAAANLSKILSALRSGAAATTSSSTSRTNDPRVSSISDPRVKPLDPRSVDPRVQDPRSESAVNDPRTADPRVQDSRPVDPRSKDTTKNIVSDPRISDPRAVVKTPLLPDPDSPVDSTISAAYDPRLNVRKPNAPSTPLLGLRPAPEINGKPVKPMDYRLRPLTLENKGVYIPPGADTSQEMLKDPRIRKRIQSLKQNEPSEPPTLPDITADLLRMQNSSGVSNSAPAPAKIDITRLSSRLSSGESEHGSRRTSTERKSSSSPGRGHGDQKTNINEPLNGKARNSSRPSFDRTQTTPSIQNAYSGFSNSRDDDEDDDHSLTIDVPDDDSRKTNGSNINGMETACS